jgi:hypothetical protein
VYGLWFRIIKGSGFRVVSDRRFRVRYLGLRFKGFTSGDAALPSSAVAAAGGALRV